MRTITKLFALLLTLSLICGFALAETVTPEQPFQRLPIPLDQDGALDFSKLDILVGTTNADSVDVLDAPGGQSILVIPNTGTLVCVFGDAGSAAPEWYQAAVQVEGEIAAGYIDASLITVSPLTDPENVIDSEAFALAFYKIYDITTLTSDQLPAGLYESVAGARPVYLSKTGTKYHYNPACSNMKNPLETTLTHALQLSKEPCKNCVKDD
ncbi:hypothetical protein AGMMS49992_08460 [Clostridia bacterium]|nr:hypothetical protein AGMMS49992_08460 [Clostridia bacterium]